MGIFYKTEHIDPCTGGLWEVEFYPAEFDFKTKDGATCVELDKRTFVVEEIVLGDFEHGAAIGLSKANSARISVALDIKQPNLDAEASIEFAERVLNPVHKKSATILKHKVSRALHEVEAGDWKHGVDIKKHNIFHLTLTINNVIVVDFTGVQDAFSGTLSLDRGNIISLELQEVVSFVLDTISFNALFNVYLYEAGRAIDYNIFREGEAPKFTDEDVFFGWGGEGGYSSYYWSKCCVHYLSTKQDAGWTWQGKGKDNIYGAILSYPVQCRDNGSWAGHRWVLYAPSGGLRAIEMKSLLYSGGNEEATQARAVYGWASAAGLYRVIEIVVGDYLQVLAGIDGFKLPKPSAKYYKQRYDGSGDIGNNLPFENLWFKAYERQGDGIYSYAANHNQTSEIYEMLDYVTVADFLQDWYLSNNNTVWYQGRRLQSKFQGEAEAITIRDAKAEIEIAIVQSKFGRIDTGSAEFYDGDRESYVLTSGYSGTQDGVNNTLTFHTVPLPNRAATSYPAYAEGGNWGAHESYDAYLPVAGERLPRTFSLAETEHGLDLGTGVKYANIWLRNSRATDPKLQLFYVEEDQSIAAGNSLLVAAHPFVKYRFNAEFAEADSVKLEWGHLNFCRWFVGERGKRASEMLAPLNNIDGMRQKIIDYFDALQNMRSQQNLSGASLKTLEKKRNAVIKMNILALFGGTKKVVLSDLLTHKIEIDATNTCVIAWLNGEEEIRCYSIQYNVASGDLQLKITVG